MINVNKIAQTINKLVKDQLGWNIDVSNVNVFFMDVDNSFYNGEFIVIDSKLSDFDREINLVHEYMHYIQDCNYFFSYDGIDTFEDNEFERTHEIDARLFSLLYINYVFGSEGVILLKSILTKNIDSNNSNLISAINNVKHQELKDLLIA